MGTSQMGLGIYRREILISFISKQAPGQTDGCKNLPCYFLAKRNIRNTYSFVLLWKVTASPVVNLLEVLLSISDLVV